MTVCSKYIEDVREYEAVPLVTAPEDRNMVASLVTASE
jgi:hypothetical protein